jgi:hypothetical protein
MLDPTQSMTLADIKGIIRQDADQSFRYSRFLILLQPEIDKPDRDPNWDLWFFSDNTTFCRDSAKIIRDEILEYGAQYRIIQQDKNADVGFTFIDLRRKFASYCMFLYAAVESFLHEVNLFYECGLQRFDVKISKIAPRLREVRRGASLNDHLHKIYASQNKEIDDDIKFLFEYRNAIVHGYVFPISGTSSGIFLTKKPREVVTFNSSDLELISFCKRIYDKISDFINDGWKCFSVDELGQSREIDQHNF